MNKKRQRQRQRWEGYTTDDNARALILVGLLALIGQLALGGWTVRYSIDTALLPGSRLRVYLLRMGWISDQAIINRNAGTITLSATFVP